jgi:hypothetical protein
MPIGCAKSRVSAIKVWREYFHRAHRNGHTLIDPEMGGILLSRIFLWYARDFGLSKRRQLQAALAYVDEAERPPYIRAAHEKGVRYAPYDWSIAGRCD